MVKSAAANENQSIYSNNIDMSKSNNIGNMNRGLLSSMTKEQLINMILRWLDWIFLGRYLPSLSLNYVGMSKDIEKRLPQLYYIKMKISYDLGFIAIGVAMAT